MSISKKMGDSNNLEFLDTDWKLATVYTAFLHPKSQQEAIRLIYKKNYVKTDKKIGKRAPIIKHPLNWIIDTREELMNEGYLVSTDYKLKNSVIKAEIEPIIKSLIASGVDGCSIPEIVEGTRLVLDSNWFRKLFSYRCLHNPITYRNKTIYEPYRDIIKQNPSGDRLEITKLKNRLFQLLYEIGYYSHNIRWMLQHVDYDYKITPTGIEDSALKDLLISQNFDEMIKKHQDFVPPGFIDAYYSCIANTRMRHMYEQFPDRLIKYLLNTNAGLFMPIPLSVLLRSCTFKSSVRPVDCGYILKEFLNDWNKAKRNYTD